ncbi:MAG: RNA 2',3'-cyclic phosphodiesterase [Zoogloeaceae bacterium]|nr:RNA 2',3'-cyclic phosphodiesterase [Zoogloeaceae bacterium]
MPAADRQRLFFALWPPEEVASALHRVAHQIQASHGGRAMQRDTLHLTLAFLGDVPLASIPGLTAAASSLDPGPAFTLTLDELGYWRHNQIVWAGVRHPPAALTRLAGDLHERLRGGGFPLESRPFRPHLTLLRRVLAPVELPGLLALAWPVDAFVLMASELSHQGARYRVIGRWRLRES